MDFQDCGAASFQGLSATAKAEQARAAGFTGDVYSTGAITSSVSSMRHRSPARSLPRSHYFCDGFFFFFNFGTGIFAAGGM